MKEDFKIWPAGKLPKEWQRVELENVKALGYEYDDPRDLVDIFEKKIANYAGSKYAIAVDNCTDAIFLCLQYSKVIGTIKTGYTITIPKRCYLSVPMVIKQCHLSVRFEDIDWSGVYNLSPSKIYDSAGRFTKDMYIPDSLYCLSFQIKKRLPIGKGGMILTDDEDAYEWFKQARFEGRHPEKDQWHDIFNMLGWNMYMTPEDAARGIILFDQLQEVNEDTQCQDNYPDLSTQEIFK